MIRATVAFIALLLVTAIVSLYATFWWAEYATLGRTFSSPYIFGFWWSPLHLLNLVDEFVLLFLAGIVLVFAAHFRRPLMCGFLFGVAFSTIRLILSRNWFAPDAGLNEYFWAYSEYFFPPFGALLGAYFGTKLRSLISSRVVA